LRYLFEDCVLDIDKRELRRGADAVSIAPQVFDLLHYLIRNREHVVSKDDLISTVWQGRIVSDAALTTRLNAARSAIGDSGEEQRLIRTLPRKGFRFVREVRCSVRSARFARCRPPCPQWLSLTSTTPQTAARPLACSALRRLAGLFLPPENPRRI
jgi:DNA-binding winged helix-turn-helix (wHTH) protein